MHNDRRPRPGRMLRFGPTLDTAFGRCNESITHESITRIDKELLRRRSLAPSQDSSPRGALQI